LALADAPLVLDLDLDLVLFLFFWVFPDLPTLLLRSRSADLTEKTGTAVTVVFLWLVGLLLRGL
jgi:hypothetical protein